MLTVQSIESNWVTLYYKISSLWLQNLCLPILPILQLC